MSRPSTGKCQQKWQDRTTAAGGHSVHEHRLFCGELLNLTVRARSFSVVGNAHPGRGFRIHCEAMHSWLLRSILDMLC